MRSLGALDSITRLIREGILIFLLLLLGIMFLFQLQNRRKTGGYLLSFVCSSLYDPPLNGEREREGEWGSAETVRCISQYQWQRLFCADVVLS